MATSIPLEQSGSRPGSPTPRAKRSAWAARRDRQGRWFVMPFLILMVLTMIVPLLYAVRESLYTTQLIGGTHFSGLDNYKAIFTDGAFWSGLIHVIIFGAIQIPFMLLMSFFFAVIFDLGAARFGSVFRGIFFIPYAVPSVVAAVIWSMLFAPSYGELVRFMGLFGLHNFSFYSSGMIWPTIFIIVIWEWTGYNMVILYTSLRSVPRELVEAAILDGATLRRVITRVKLPMVKPAIEMLVFLNMIGALQMYVEPSIIAQFQPQAISDSFTPTIFIYNTGVNGQEYGQAAAAAVILGIVIVLISLAVFALRKRRGEFS